MKKLLILLLSTLFICGIATLSIGCTTIQPGSGIGSNVVISGALMEKTGEAEAAFLFGLIPLGDCDCSLASAASDGGITKIATVDTRWHASFLGIVVTRTTIVTGE